MQVVIMILLIIVIIILLFFLQFYRDPERISPKGNHILSPADGRIINIVDVEKKEGLISLKTDKKQLTRIIQGTTNPKWLIQIYLSPFDCHMTRSPVHGKITKITHVPGRLINAFRKDSIKNERVEFLIKTKKETIKNILVGAPFVHKIRKKVEEQEKVKAGQRLAQFLLGSQVTLILPEVDLQVKKGQHVRAGQSIIAALR